MTIIERGIAMIGVALVIAYSRAGIVLFFAGVFVWALVSIRFSKSVKYLGVMLTAMLLLLAGFLSFGGSTLKRFQSSAGGGARDFRIPIQQDALQLSTHAPFLGSGLGNFEPLFRLVRDKSRQQDYALHPDSDWLWAAVDLGWIAVAALLIGLIIWIRRCFRFDSRESATLRLAAMVYGLGFAAAGFVDVSGHRIGTLWPALFVMGLAIRSDQSEINSRWIPPLFRCVGLVLMGIAGCWMLPTIGFRSFPTSDTLARYQQAANFDFEGADYDHLVETTTAALRIAPLDWNSYSQRAVAEANLAETEAAIRDFRIARFLQPHFVETCDYEGSLWLDLGQSAYALEAWKEALRRAPDGGAFLFSAILSATAHRPEIFAQVKTWGLGNLGLELVLMAIASPEEFKTQLDALLVADPELKRLSPEERKRLFQVWAQKGDAVRLTELLRAHPQWEKEEWRVLARHFAGGGDFRRAYDTAVTFGPKPTLPKMGTQRSRSDIERDLALNPDDLVSGLALYGLHVRQESFDDALNTLRKLKLAHPKLQYLSFMEAELHAKKEDWKEAWNAWEGFENGSE